MELHDFSEIEKKQWFVSEKHVKLSSLCFHKGKKHQSFSCLMIGLKGDLIFASWLLSKFVLP